MTAEQLAIAEAEAATKPVGEYYNLDQCKTLPITRAEMSAAFDEVKSSVHWKDPIRAEVPYATALLYAEAVVFFHGARPRLVRVPKCVGDILTPYILIGDGYAC